MTNNNLLLYGSYARKDFHEKSDIDLLSVTDSNPNKIVKGNINLSIYNLEKIRKMSDQGALFIYHLVMEGVILNDEGNLIQENIFSRFVLKNDYNTELYFSKCLLKDIQNRYKKLKYFTYANSKISWCLRTFIAAFGANKSVPLFSASKIIEEFNKEIVGYINIKHSSQNHYQLIDDILVFMDNYFPDKNCNIFDQELEKYRKDILHNMVLHSQKVAFFY